MSDRFFDPDNDEKLFPGYKVERDVNGCIVRISQRVVLHQFPFGTDDVEVESRDHECDYGHTHRSWKFKAKNEEGARKLRDYSEGWKLLRTSC